MQARKTGVGSQQRSVWGERTTDEIPIERDRDVGHDHIGAVSTPKYRRWYRRDRTRGCRRARGPIHRRNVGCVPRCNRDATEKEHACIPPPAAQQDGPWDTAAAKRIRLNSADRSGQKLCRLAASQSGLSPDRDAVRYGPQGPPPSPPAGRGARVRPEKPALVEDLASPARQVTRQRSTGAEFAAGLRG